MLFAREPDDEWASEGGELPEATEELEVLIRRLAEADARIDADALLADAATDRERDPLLQEREHFRHDVVVVRALLHRPWLAQHVHQTDIPALLGYDRGHFQVASECGHVVDQLRAQLERPARDLRLGGVDGDGDSVQPFEDWHDAPQLLVELDRLRAGSGRLTADVHDRRPLGDEPPGVLGCLVGRREPAPVREAVRRHVHDAQHRRPGPALVDRRTLGGAHAEERNVACAVEKAQNARP